MIIAPNSRELLKTIVREDDGEMLFALLDSVLFVIDDVEYILLERYLSDGFSMVGWLKKLFRKLFLAYPTLIFAAILHDWLYSKSRNLDWSNRSVADLTFKRLMIHYGAPWIAAQLFYSAVRAFGWMFWRKKEDVFYPIHHTSSPNQ